MKQIVFATENQGKVHEVAVFAKHYGYEILTPSQAGFTPVEVEETGTTYEENARLKVEAYRKQAKAKDFVICGDDTGIEINALGGEPGLHTRRWLGYRMSDDEVMGYVLGRMHGIEDRRAVFKSTVAYSVNGGEIQIATGELAGRITSVPMEAEVQPGVPFRKLFVIEGPPEIPLWKFDEMPVAERGDIHSHREKAFLDMFENLI